MRHSLAAVAVNRPSRSCAESKRLYVAAKKQQRVHKKQVRGHAAVQHVAAVTTYGLEHTYGSAVCGRIDNLKQKCLTAYFAPNGTSDQRQAAVGEGVAAVAKRAREQKVEALADTLKQYIRDDDEELKFFIIITDELLERVC